MTIYALGDLVPQFPEDGDYWVAPDANVIGQVVLNSGCSVWFGSTLRGDNEPIEIGAGSNIQENCVLHTDPGFALRVGENCTIGHKAMLHGCTVEDGTLIGMGATVLNGAVIGAGCLIGAGALIGEKKVIPPRSLVVGAPGRVIRKVDERTYAFLQTSARVYQERMRRYGTDLKVIG